MADSSSSVGPPTTPSSGRLPRDAGSGRRLARAFVDAGHRVGLIHAARLAGRRRAWSVDDATATWRRRTAEGGHGRLAPAIVVFVAVAVAFGLPLLLPLLALVSDVPPTSLAGAALPLALLVLVRLLLAVTQQQPVLSIVWHPVTVLVALIGQVGGIWDRVRGVDLPADDAGRTRRRAAGVRPVRGPARPGGGPARYGLPTV